MFESNTYEKILGDMLTYIPDSFDKREGSIIYDALAPAAIKLAEAYIDLDLILLESFADTASRPYLVKRCAERGIYPLPATNAVVKMEFNIDVPIDSRFSFNEWNFKVSEQITTGQYKAVCEETGPVYGTGDATPIQFIQGLTYARVTEILINGEDEEDTEALRTRYFNSFMSQAFGGNRADYMEKVPQLQDVGAVKAKRVQEGDMNVRLTIVNSTFDGASAELVEAVQTSVDPVVNSGEGYGIAPIGHRVIVAGVVDKTINIASKFTFQDGYDFDDLKSALERAIDVYFRELNTSWGLQPDGQGLVVRISQLETRFLDVDGVVDVTGTTINGNAENLVLAENEIAKRGELTNLA